MSGRIDIPRAPVRTLAHRGNYRITRDLPMSPPIMRSAARVAAHLEDPRPDRSAGAPARPVDRRTRRRQPHCCRARHYAAARREQDMAGTSGCWPTRRTRTRHDTELRCQKIKHTIPERRDQIARRKAKGSPGGRPPASTPIYGHATPSNEASTGSNTGVGSRPATTNTRSPTSAESYWPAQSSTPA